MADQLIAITVLTPLMMGVLVTLLGIFRKGIGAPIAVITTGVTLLCTLGLLWQVQDGGAQSYHLGGWEPPMGIELRVDSLNALVLCAIACVAFLVSISSLVTVKEDTPRKEVPYYTLFLILLSGLLGMTMTGDAFNVFVLVEVASLTSYGLIAMGRNRKAPFAAFNYIILGTIGASLYLLGVGYLFLKTGSLNMADLKEIINAAGSGLFESKAIHVALILIMIGIWIKMALFPLHGWLPNCYTYAPSASGSMLAPLMTKISVYLMIRLMLGVFGAGYIFNHIGWSDAVVWLAIIAIVAGSLFALAQKDLKQMLCYLIVAEVGYMVGGAWLGNETAMLGTSYHILSDAFMTLCLFLAASIFIRQLGSTSIASLSGMFRKMPLTSAGFALGAFAMIGIPPTCGFFSKYYLVRGGIEAGHWPYVIALLFSSLVNAVLFFRIFEIGYFPKKVTEGTGDHDYHDAPKSVKTCEPPVALLFPLLATAALLVLIGVANGSIVDLLRDSISPYFAELSSGASN